MSFSFLRLIFILVSEMVEKNYFCALLSLNYLFWIFDRFE
jgi:hypothetical protein